MPSKDRTAFFLDTLEPETRALAYAMVGTLRHFGLPIVVVDLGARRSLAEQQDLVRRGLSKDLKSKHLRGEAFDIDLWGVNRDWVPLWVWQIIGPWAERAFNLRWGGRWGDYGHFEKQGGGPTLPTFL